MTLVTLRPNGTIVMPGGVSSGSPSASHTLLRDDSDATWITLVAGQIAQFTTDDLSLPSGAVIKNVAFRVRATGNGSQVLAGVVTLGSTKSVEGRFYPLVNYVTVELGTRGTGWTDSEIDSAYFQVEAGPLPVGCGITELYCDVRYVTQPVVAVSAPTGTVTLTNRPLVQWTNTLDGEGGTQTYYWVRIFSAAQYGIGGFNPATSPATYDSGQVASGATSHQPLALADGTYRAYVRTAQTVNGAQTWSAWDYEPFVVDVLRPAVPSLILTAQSSSGRVVVEAHDNVGDATTDGFDLERSIDDGATWAAVRTQTDETGRVLTSDITIYDYEAPNGVTVMYRARALHDYGGGSFAESDWVQASTIWQSTQWWLKHPNVPALNMPVELVSYPDANRAARQGSFQPLGAALPVVVADTRGGETGTVVLQCYSLVEQTALNALLDLTATLFLQGPAEDDKPDRYVRIGDHGSARVVDKSFVALTHETLAWTLVDAPLGAQLGMQYAPAEDDGEALVIA